MLNNQVQQAFYCCIKYRRISAYMWYIQTKT